MVTNNAGGNANVAVGNYALDALTSGDDNVAVGHNALTANTTGSYSTAVGRNALEAATTGVNNTAVGFDAASALTTGDSNVAVGDRSMGADVTGDYNTGVGYATLYELTTGTGNIAIGRDAGRANSPSGSITTNSNRMVLGDNNITNAHVKVDWTVTSDERDKADITDFTHGLNYVNQLRPVNYVWDDRTNYEDGVSDGTKKKDLIDIGFLAQEVQAIETDLGIDNHAIVDTSNADIFGIKYARLIPVLVNAIQELSAEVEALKAKLKD